MFPFSKFFNLLQRSGRPTSESRAATRDVEAGYLERAGRSGDAKIKRSEAAALRRHARDIRRGR